MDSKRLKSYNFKCPCCSEPHTRLFEYYAKFRGMIPEDQPLPEGVEVNMLERVVMDNGTYEGRSVTAGDGIFRCGNCFEFFKFNDKISEPVGLTQAEQRTANFLFKPIKVTYYQAVMNSIATFDSLLNSTGCEYDEVSRKIIVKNKNGKEYRLDFADELVKAFYGNNPNFEIKHSNAWAYEPGELERIQQEKQ